MATKGTFKFGEAASLFARRGIRAQRQQLRFFTSSKSTASCKPASRFSDSPLVNLLYRHATRPSVRHLFSRQRATQRRLLSDKKPDISSSKDYNPTKNLGSPAGAGATEKSLSLSERLKKLSREYGWSALGVYFLLSALDFPFCFIAVRLIGTEKIAVAEHAVINFVKRAIPFQIPEKWGGQGRLTRKQEEDVEGLKTGHDHGVRQADEQNTGDNASTLRASDARVYSRLLRSVLEERGEPHANTRVLGIWTQLALAYAIHKSFIFVRVPLTAAVTPKVVKTLRSWGWNIGKRSAAAPKAKPA